MNEVTSYNIVHLFIERDLFEAARMKQQYGIDLLQLNREFYWKK